MNYRLSMYAVPILFSLVMMFLSLMFFVYPLYQTRSLLKIEEGSWKKIEKISTKIPLIYGVHREEMKILQAKFEIKITLQALEEIFVTSNLYVESMQPYQGGAHDELDVKLRGEYINLVKFFESLAENPNAMEVIYLSVNEDEIEIIFKDKNL